MNDKLISNLIQAHNREFDEIVMYREIIYWIVVLR